MRKIQWEKSLSANVTSYYNSIKFADEHHKNQKKLKSKIFCGFFQNELALNVAKIFIHPSKFWSSSVCLYHLCVHFYAALFNFKFLKKIKKFFKEDIWYENYDWYSGFAAIN